MDEVNLAVDELESIRLADLEGMYQDAAAERMNVSRQTFGNIVNSARRKIADVLVNGKAIRIEGGNFEIAHSRFRCQSGHEWEVETSGGITPVFCPTCSTTDIQPVLPAGFGAVSSQFVTTARADGGPHVEFSAASPSCAEECFTPEVSEETIAR